MARPLDRRTFLRTSLLAAAAGSVTRVSVQCERRFWTDGGFNGFALVDQPVEVWSPTHDQPGPRGILQAYPYEALSRKVTAMDADGRVRWAVDLLDQVHPGVRARYEGAAVKCWEEDPWVGGAFALTRPGQITTLAVGRDNALR
ncbi:MAG: hypothetical protein DMF78_19175 [Acidobacteria bacterium]|nr:MAG: hypothetical protein DMF78_19175 [Acidobacteriota bacterium]